MFSEYIVLGKGLFDGYILYHIVCLYYIYNTYLYQRQERWFLELQFWLTSQDTCLKQLDRAVSEVPWQTGSCSLVSFLVPR